MACGKPTYRLGLESGDRDRGEKEPLIYNECLVSVRQDISTEFDLRQKVASLETRLWVFGFAFSKVFGLPGLLASKFFL